MKIGTSSLPAERSDALGDLGCPFEIPQRMTLRPQLSREPYSLRVEAYGAVGRSMSVPLAKVDGLYRFDAKRLGLSLSGYVTDRDVTSRGMGVNIQQLSWHGQSVCSPGRYLLTGGQ